MNIIPRLHYVIINEYLNAILKLGLHTKAINTLRILDDGKYFPTHMHVSTVIRSITKDPTRTLEAAELLEHFKYTYRTDRYSTFANQYSESCLCVLHGFDLAGSYNEAIDFVLRNDILKFVEQTRCGKLLAKILSILLRQKNFTLFNQLKSKYLENIFSSDYPFIKSKDRLLYVLINYHSLLGEVDQTTQLLSKVEMRDSKLYLSVVKQLYTKKSAEFLEKFIFEAIPPIYRNNYHLGYLIRKLVDEKQYEKAKQIFISIPHNERTYILCDQYLRGLYMEKNPKQNIIEALTIYEELVKTKQETESLIYTNVCAYYVMQILYDGGFNVQLESFFNNLGTVTIPQLMLMAKYYLEVNNIEKVEMCREEIKKVRPLAQNFREYMTISN
ncbi:predicted protein [Naegleria gruberi]|uniref:Predicted protein n=1 Tax=Naegleria gruberi TaxID=5762 RepID=D2UXL1_NAEGR|nr:uncharacterized protein NAEGRDRAFT_61164 [Naegleria gruberi]EFC50302.1 predicted protein [Naegleria gruberi]|eukprot:XP_002683046.1 predicted protein [Naegleria gruberi strain NEG-M]